MLAWQQLTALHIHPKLIRGAKEKQQQQLIKGLYKRVSALLEITLAQSMVNFTGEKALTSVNAVKRMRMWGEKL